MVRPRVPSTRTSHWSSYHERWARLGPPLRPSADVVAAVARVIVGHVGPTLLLGVTPELAEVSADITAVDKSESMIRGVWPGDGPGRRALCANWLALPFPQASFGTVVGDGCLTTLAYPEEYVRLGVELRRVLRGGGRAVMRAFVRPGVAERSAEVCAAALAGRIRSFHAFKWRFAMALVAELGSANLSVQAIHDAFTQALPDRRALARRAGWALDDIGTIDVYRGSAELYSFPNHDELIESLRASFRNVELAPVEGYELAERCPLLVLDR